MNTKYQIYLKSDKWQSFKNSIILDRGFKCENCSKVPNLENGELLHLHHLTYERIFNELKTDVKLLCPKCHLIEHGKIKVSVPKEYNKTNKNTYNPKKDNGLIELNRLIDKNKYYFYIFSSNSNKLNESIDYGFNIFKGNNLIHSDIMECSDNDYNTQNKGELLAFIHAVSYIENQIGYTNEYNVFTSNNFISQYALNHRWENKKGFQSWFDLWQKCNKKVIELNVSSNFIKKDVAKKYLV